MEPPRGVSRDRLMDVFGHVFHLRQVGPHARLRGGSDACVKAARRGAAQENRPLVKVCVIGVGRAGLVHAKNLQSRIPAAELVSLCDASPENLAAAGKALEISRSHRDYREALAQSGLDAVVVATPTFLHRDVCVAAAAAGKHIFLEKPMALTVEECGQINEAVARAGVRLQIGFMRRFDEGFQRAKRLLEGGQMGRLMLIKSTGRGPGGPGPWMWDLRKSNGIVAEVNSHDLDSLLWFTGRAVRRVYAEAHNFKVPEAAERFPDFYDNVVATFRFDDGAMGVLDGTCPAHYGYDARVEILCEKGVIFIGSAQQHGMWHITVEGQVAGQAVRSWRDLFKDAYLAEMEHFIDCVAGDKPPAVTGADGLRAVELVLAVNEAIRQARPVALGERDTP